MASPLAASDVSSCARGCPLEGSSTRMPAARGWSRPLRKQKTHARPRRPSAGTMPLWQSIVALTLRHPPRGSSRRRPAGAEMKLNIDPIIELIKASPTSQEAREKLLAQSWAPGDVLGMLERAGDDACRPDELGPQYGLRDGQYHLSQAQAQAILDLRLHRLTGLEHEKLLNEYQEKLQEIADYLDILADPERLKLVMAE